MKYAARLLAVIVLALFLPYGYRTSHAAERIKISMTPDRWKTEGGAEFVKHKGFDSLSLKPGDYAAHIKAGQGVPNDISFRNGTIEFDVDPLGSMGTGIAFRQSDDKSFGYFYFRPRPKCSEAVDCIQYAPNTHGVLLWDLFPQYQAPAPLIEGEWNHIKLVISGQRMNVFVNGSSTAAQTPTLKVGSLEGDTLEGGLVFQGPGFFANVVLTPDAVEGLAAEPEQDPTTADARYVRNWQLSPFSELAADKQPAAADLPASSAAWLPIAAERYGLVDISRQYGLPVRQSGWSLAWLKTSIASEKNQTKKVSIGWTREVWVFVNGQQVFADKNLYQPPAARKTPDGRCSLENGSFDLPLKAGDNVITVALADNFYGWGLILRLDDLNGVQLAKK
jgi:hypothetical protein